MKTSTMLIGLKRRLTNAGLRCSRSDRSETIYVSIGVIEVRVSFHELGYADYGSRKQVHRGPEAIVPADASASDALAAIHEELRLHLYGFPTKLCRDATARDLRAFRAVCRKAGAIA